MRLKKNFVNMSEFKIRLLPGAKLPEYKTDGSAGMDIFAFSSENTVITLKPGEYKLVRTGIFIELPEFYEAQIRPRSGLAINSGITVLNSPGTIDSDYRGEIGVILINHSTNDFSIQNGDRIAQMVITKYERVLWNQVSNLHKTKRNEGGFGHTGIQ